MIEIDKTFARDKDGKLTPITVKIYDKETNNLLMEFEMPREFKKKFEVLLKKKMKKKIAIIGKQNKKQINFKELLGNNDNLINLNNLEFNKSCIEEFNEGDDKE